MHEAFYGKYNGLFRACANSVYQAYPRGEGPGNEAISSLENLGFRFNATLETVFTTRRRPFYIIHI